MGLWRYHLSSQSRLVCFVITRNLQRVRMNPKNIYNICYMALFSRTKSWPRTMMRSTGSTSLDPHNRNKTDRGSNLPLSPTPFSLTSRRKLHNGEPPPHHHYLRQRRSGPKRKIHASSWQQQQQQSEKKNHFLTILTTSLPSDWHVSIHSYPCAVKTHLQRLFVVAIVFLCLLPIAFAGTNQEASAQLARNQSRARLLASLPRQSRQRGEWNNCATLSTVSFFLLSNFIGRLDKEEQHFSQFVPTSAAPMA